MGARSDTASRTEASYMAFLLMGSFSSFPTLVSFSRQEEPFTPLGIFNLAQHCWPASLTHKERDLPASIYCCLGPGRELVMSFLSIGQGNWTSCCSGVPHLQLSSPFSFLFQAFRMPCLLLLLSKSALVVITVAKGNIDTTLSVIYPYSDRQQQVSATQ